MIKRVNSAAGELRKAKLDALLISNPVNVTYLTGFRPADGYFLLTSQGGGFYFTNFLYEEEARKIPFWKVFISRGNIFNLTAAKIKNLGLRKVGFEAKHMPFSECKKIKENFIGKGVNFLETCDFIENLRAVKSAGEISLIKKSVKISLEALDFVKEIYSQDMTEKGLAIEIERFLKLKGDYELAFKPIVAFGENSAFPHHLALEGRCGSDFFLTDLGAKVYGYCADLTRMFFWDKISILFKNVYDTVEKAKDRAIKKIKDGVCASEIDKAGREIIEKKGYGKYFGHGIGHSVGLAVHEAPFLNAVNAQVLKKGMVLTIEPAVYIPGKFGIRIEEMVLVGDRGAEVLSGNGDW